MADGGLPEGPVGLREGCRRCSKVNEVLAPLLQGVVLAGSARDDARALLARHGRTRTIEHSKRVAAEATRLAHVWGAECGKAASAGWLHDISAILAPDQRLAAAEKLGIEILAEERQAPMILHQKLSAAIATGGLGVDDLSILRAIGCHTTLRAGASILDKIVFIADKIAWDQAGAPPYLAEVLGALEQSLDLAVYRYLDYLWQRRGQLAVVHPWLVEAYDQLSSQLAVGE